MSVVGTHGDRAFTTLLQKNKSLHYVVHIYISFQVVGFVEVAFLITLRTAQMHKVHTVAKTFHHTCKVIIGTHTERACTQTKTVGLIRYGFNQFSEIFFRTQNTRQS